MLIRSKIRRYIIGFILSILFWLLFYWIYGGSVGNTISAKTVQSLPSNREKISSFLGKLQEFTSYIERRNSLNGSNVIEDIGLVTSEKELQKREEGYRRYAFNVLISDRIGYKRSLPDFRHQKCYENIPRYPNISIKASVIICFYNEAWSTLLRTIFSVINNSPIDLIREIILLDDRSNYYELTHDLPIYVRKQLPIVTLLHTAKREGLIRARLKAAEYASGEALVFLDSHCEVTQGWLVPLLARIQKDRRNVVCPVIDTINPDTFTYVRSPPVRGGFNWGMHFSWEPLPANLQLDMSVPYSTPTMSGGLFAINRNYFFQLGSYDSGMNIWGGENLELSFRIWMCGGKLEIVPCSHVGHVFREHRPYGDGRYGNAMAINSLRLVEVWLDEYKQHFYNLKPELKAIKVDVTARKVLRDQLKCKSFKWYLDVVYPELGIPMIREGYPFNYKKSSEVLPRFEGKLRNVGLLFCLDTSGDPLKKKSTILLRKCKKTMTHKVILNFDDELKFAKKMCLDVLLYSNSNNQARSMKCHGSKSGQEWKLKDGTHLYNPALGMCLAATTKKLAIIQICDWKSELQQWQFIP